MQVLLYLAHNNGHVVSTDELIEEVWKSTVVSPQSVHRCISKLRKLLATDDKSDVFIRTYPKKGYALEIEPTPYLGEESPLPTDEPVSETSASKRNTSALIWAGVLVVVLAIALWFAFGGAESTDNTPNSNVLNLPVINDSEHYYMQLASNSNQSHIATVRQTKSGVELIYQDPDMTQTIDSFDTGYADYRLAWSKDGQTLALSRYANRMTQIFTYQLDPQSLSFEQRKVVYESQKNRVGSMSWNNDNHILVTLTLLNEWEHYLYRLEPESGALYPTDFKQQAHQAKFGHGMIAIATRDYRQNHITVVNEEFELIERLTTLLNITDLELMPDGSGIVFSESDTLYRWYFNRRHAEPILTANGVLQNLTVTENEQYLYIESINDSNIKRHNINTRAVRVTGTNANERLPTFAHNSDMFAFVSDASGSEQIVTTNGNEQTTITNFDDEHTIDGMFWSTDDLWLLIQRGQQVLLYSFAVNSSKVVMDHNLFVEVIGLSNDHQHLFYSDSNSDPRTFYKFSIIDGSNKALSIPANSNAITINGELFFSARNSNKLFKLEPNNTRTFVTNMPYNSQFVSSSKSKLYYYLNRANQIKNIYEFDLTTGEHKLIVERGGYRGTVTSVQENEFLTEVDDPQSQLIQQLNH